jgi:ABC-type multidrug transport system fused ATPase/permease subunit
MAVFRDLAAALGALLVLYTGWSVLGAFVVPRRVRTRLTHTASAVVAAVFHMAADRFDSYEQRDRILAVQGPLMLIGNLITWLGLIEVGYGLLLWPFVHGGIGQAMLVAGSALTTLGYAVPGSGAPAALADLAGFMGLGTVALLIGYLPTLYAAFNRRESLVTLLDARASVPSWGPELLARTHYGLGTGVSAVEELPELFDRWESWSADLAESHSTYPILARFRSPKALSSWFTAQLAILDAAALYLSLLRSPPQPLVARLCLRGGFDCLRTIARVLGGSFTDDPNPDDGIELTYAEFLDALERLRRVDFPVERDPEEAWADFVGWRVNYERAAYYIAWTIDAPPALWSGPRRGNIQAVPPLRPELRKAKRSKTPSRARDRVD